MSYISEIAILNCLLQNSIVPLQGNHPSTPSLHRHGLCQIPRLINVGALGAGYVIGE